VARQLRLRDLGGLVVIDFIDMEKQRNQREVESRVRDELHADRARIQTSKISRFGLLELSRQRLRPSLGEGNHAPCPRCHGTGHIRGIESTALHILRITQEEAMKDNSAIIQVQLPVDAATFLLNEKRADIHKIEELMGVEVILIPNIHLETPNYNIVRIKQDDVSDDARASYSMVEEPDQSDYTRSKEEGKAVAPEALVKGVKSTTPAPITKKNASTSFLGRIKKWLGGEGEVKSADASNSTEQKPTPAREKNRNRNRNKNRNRNRNEKSQQQVRASNPQHKQQNRTDAAHDETKVAKSDNTAVEQSAKSNNQSRNSRRSRGGRRDRKPREEMQNTQMVESDITTVKAATKTTNAVPTATKEVATDKPAVTGTKVEAKTEAKPAAKPRRSRASQSQTKKAEKPAAKKASKPRTTRKAKTEKPADDLADSGLQLVETKSKTKTKAAPKKAAKPKAKRKPANWKKEETPTKDEPLVMVETQK